ncbi:MAG: M23 family metallopeptidase [Tannerella sp.]|nr:M23 family metallopeptidase [Tannerella sp.]
MKKLRLIALIIFVTINYCCAQQLINPFDFPITLSGNFGELRADHLHAGIDFKTQHREGQAVHAVKSGYVSRITVGPWGYGNALYMTHPDSTITVYGHLQRFNNELTACVKAKQYEAESFQIDLSFDPEQFAYRQNEIIAYSGNTGSSAGPHLHFEIRDARTGDLLDPIPFFRTMIKDAQAPVVRAIMVIPVEGQGVANGSADKLTLNAAKSKDGSVSFGQTIEAWGKIGFTINADDLMDGTSNVYGVKEILVTLDGKDIFRSRLDRFSYDDSHFINAWIDYDTWVSKKRFFTKTYVEYGNKMRFIESENRGYITVNEQRNYAVGFKLTDALGNVRKFTVNIIGKEQDIPSPDTEGAVLFGWRGDNRFGARGIRLMIPDGGVYNSFYFRHTAKTDTAYNADIHRLNDKPTALNKIASLSLRLTRDDLTDKSQYGIVKLQNRRISWKGGVYRDGWIDGEISELGDYTVMVDTVAPRITPVDEAQWAAKRQIALRLTDNLSGVAKWQATIDGEYALFVMDGKKALIYYAFDPERLKRGKHSLKVTAADACNNLCVYDSEFEW